MSALLARILPFCLYMAFIAIQEIVPLLGLDFTPRLAGALYPVKIGLVALALLLLWKRYDELRWADLRRARDTMLSLGLGLIVFVLWVNLDLPLVTSGTPQGFDPGLFGDLRLPMTAVRLLGAALVVPVMEELFWRSFLVRYLIDRNFTAVRHGTFTLFTFAATAVLFGLEHHLWLAGILAGAAYNYIYLRTRSVTQCVLSHAATNFALGVYVVSTGNWLFW